MKEESRIKMLEVESKVEMGQPPARGTRGCAKSGHSRSCNGWRYRITERNSRVNKRVVGLYQKKAKQLGERVGIEIACRFGSGSYYEESRSNLKVPECVVWPLWG